MRIEFYEAKNGGCPLNNYLDSLNPKLLAKTLKTIDLLEQNGSSLRSPYSEYLKDDIFELRTKQSTNITRILYFFVVGDKAILTNGFTKKQIKRLQKKLN